MEQKQKIYCSLDIETSGFDPLTNEILEVGFVVFKIEDLRFEIVEQWTQVFKPTKPVAPQILGLTGITQRELDEAPEFGEHKEFLQEKLGDVIIVGHNVIFDIKFLEAFGIKFSGQVIDTLDLVQFILPTHHSYNLENLMHTFGISHKDAHRALADSKATLKLLESLIGVYRGFPERLKTGIGKLIKGSDFLWEDFLSLNIAPLKFKDLLDEEAQSPAPIAQLDFEFTEGVIYNLQSNNDYVPSLAQALKASKKKSLLVLPKPQQVLELYRRGLVDDQIFLSEFQFDEKKFLALQKKKGLSPEEVRFALKILVWQEVNCQSQTVLDLNLSFFGGQFKGLITGGKLKENPDADLIACDHAAFLEMSNLGLCKGRQVLISGLNEFEGSITKDLGAKISWGYINYLLKSFYNFELNIGQEKFMEPVKQALADTDLFFGLINALLQTDPPSFQYFKITAQTQYQENYLKIKGAAENYKSKLSKHNETFQSEAIFGFMKDLNSFFETQDNRVKWIELSENRCALLSMPIEISGLVRDLLKPFTSISFADSLGPESLVRFFTNRLGIESFTLASLDYRAGKSFKKINLRQGDLFSGLKKALSYKQSSITYNCVSKIALPDEILELITKKNAFPAAVLFSNLNAVREFYDQNYQKLKEGASVLAQSNSGGSNKIFRNFSINCNSLLLATDKFILKYLAANSAVEQVLNLSVKTLVICRLPFEQFTHPYQEAISQSLPNAFIDYALPKALFNFHSLIKFFNTPLLENIYVIDAKLSKEYASVFKDYYKYIPNSKIKD